MATKARHVERSIEDQNGQWQRVSVNLGESPLSWLYARGKLTERQFRAGEALRADWERAGLGPSVTMRWDVTPLARGRRAGPSALSPTEAQMAARERFHGAVAMAGSGLADVLWRVACAGEGIAAAEQALGWPVRSGKLVLSFALDRVAGFYRIAGQVSL